MEVLSTANILKYDPSGMHEVYDRWAQMAKTSYESNNETADFKNIDHVVFSGMGGSGTIGDIFSSILSKSDLHTRVVKGYHLPNTVDKNTLVIVISVSGDTAETLTVLKSCSRLDCKTIAFSSGGKMMDYCIKNNIEHKKINFSHSPRASLPSFLYCMLSYFGPLFNIEHEDVLKSIKHLENLQQLICTSNLTSTNISLDLAKWINGIPVIYYPWGLRAAAIRFKNSLQENAKNHAMVEDVVEVSHNGIVPWQRSSNVQPILIRGRDDYFKTKERWEIIKEYFRMQNIVFREIFSVEGNILSKLIHLIYLLDYSTIYRSILSHIDPSPIEAIDFIKQKS